MSLITDKQIRSALKACSTVREAAEMIGMNPNTLSERLRRQGVTASTLLKAKPLTAQGVLEQHQAKRSEAKLKAEHKVLVEELKEANARSSVLDRLGQYKIPVIKPLEVSSRMREGTAVVSATDWHFEETVSREQACGLNEYNLAIARKRAERYFVGVQWLIEAARNTHKVRNLIFWPGGDLITGYIHQELVETNELAPVEAVLEVSDVLFTGISQLLLIEDLTITVPCSYGNHGRTTEKRRVKTGAQNSYEWLMYNQLARRFAGDKRIQFVIDKSAHQFVDAYGFGLHFTHGDELKYGGGVGGLAIPLGKRVPKWDRLHPNTAYHHIGHFHQCQRIGRTFCNGSLIGYNEYAISIGADYEPPMQSFYLLDSKRGAQFMTNVWCDESAVGKLAT